MPGLYLATILFSIGGVTLLARRFLPGVVGPRLLRPILAVLAVFLAFDVIGAARGWFASSPDWVVIQVPPGIPLEEPLLLGFLALFSVVLYEAGAVALGEAATGGPAADA
ncbi:MAG: hypothetical protein MUC54_04655 [Chloroflexi bacterium]|nr:hypothetical protein [Chloroflexota bacterium]